MIRDKAILALIILFMVAALGIWIGGWGSWVVFLFLTGGFAAVVYVYRYKRDKQIVDHAVFGANDEKQSS